jgi:hypothetical protein
VGVDPLIEKVVHPLPLSPTTEVAKSRAQKNGDKKYAIDNEIGLKTK